jgi:2'-5' RNA ligase
MAALDTALVVHVPEAESLVRDVRLRFDPSAAAGVAAHVTLVTPFVPLARLDRSSLGETLAHHQPFAFRLTGLAGFRGVLYLAPDPAEPFAALSRELVERFGTPLYGRPDLEPVPHLTVAMQDDDEALDAAASLLDPLPIACSATEVTLIECDRANRWQEVERLALGAPP